VYSQIEPDFTAAKFPGDPKKYISEHLMYPPDARIHNIQGTVYVSFMVETDGSVSNVKIVRGVYSSLDTEAIHLISNMPKWIPTKKPDGTPIAERISTVVEFILPDSSAHRKDTIVAPFSSSNCAQLQNDSNPVYNQVDEYPQFPGGINKYLADNIKYPEDAKKNNIQGYVYLSFVVEKDGSISTIRVMRSPNASLSNEAIRVVSTTPKWTPGKKKGVPVRVYQSVRVIFAL
jgi:TonB family protein